MRAAALLTAALALPAAAGVPVSDPGGLATLNARLAKALEDAGVQAEKGTVRTELLAKTEATATLDDTRTLALTRPAAVVRALQDTPAYQPDADRAARTEAAATRLFGVPRPGIERLIIDVVVETAGSPGVTGAGLDLARWRALFQALVKQESAFNPAALSPAGAMGLTQLMPGTARDLGVDPRDPLDNLRGGARYLATQLGQFGRVDHALAAYNAGPGAVRKHGGIPPYRETQAYVTRIRGFAAAYLSKLGSTSPLEEGITEPALIASGEAGRTGEAVTYSAEALLGEADAARARLETLLARLDSGAGLPEAEAFNAAAKAELAGLLCVGPRAAVDHVIPVVAMQLVLVEVAIQGSDAGECRIVR